MRNFLILLLSLSSFCVNAQGLEDAYFKWEQASKVLKDISGHRFGAYIGLIDKNRAIIAGGVTENENFNDVIHLLYQKEDGSFEVQRSKINLPQALAYGLAITIESGIICVGGCNKETCSSKVFLLQWDPSNQQIKKIDLPDLPQPLGKMSGAIINNSIYIAGGMTDPTKIKAEKYFCKLDITDWNQVANSSWQTLKTWKGSARINGVGVGQGNGLDNCFYLIGGENEGIQLKDVHAFNPKLNTWIQLDDIKYPLAETTRGLAVGAANILLFGEKTLNYYTITDQWNIFSFWLA